MSQALKYHKISFQWWYTAQDEEKKYLLETSLTLIIIWEEGGVAQVRIEDYLLPTFHASPLI